MSLKNRQQQNPGAGQTQTYAQLSGQPVNSIGMGIEPRTVPALIAGREYFSVVDGEIVNVVGSGDIPGMSLAWLCQADDDGSTALISHKEAPLFTTAQRALQFLNEQRGNPTSRMNNRP